MCASISPIDASFVKSLLKEPTPRSVNEVDLNAPSWMVRLGTRPGQICDGVDSACFELIARVRPCNGGLLLFLDSDCDFAERLSVALGSS